MNFFLDENMPERATRLLRAFDSRGHTFAYLLDHFPIRTADLTWLPVVGAWDPRPTILSGDSRILTTDLKRAALRQSGCSFVYFGRGWGNTTWEPFGQRLVRCWPDVRGHVEATVRQTVFEVTINGRIYPRVL